MNILQKGLIAFGVGTTIPVIIRYLSGEFDLRSLLVNIGLVAFGVLIIWKVFPIID